MNAQFRIGEQTVGGDSPCFIIAEIGSNHNLSLSMAKELIRVAAHAGANAVKFQSQQLHEQYIPALESREFIEFFQKTELPEEWYHELAHEANQHDIIFFSSPTYLRAVDLLESVDVSVYKIASPQAATYPQLVERVVRTGKPVIISTGMLDYEGLSRLMQMCQDAGNPDIAILHCVSKYPTAPSDANLKTMATFRAMFGCPVGFSDHTTSTHVPLAAVALGASILEKHLTLDRSLPGPDHGFAMEPGDFAGMVAAIRDIEQAIGDGIRRQLDAELQAFVSHIDMRLVARDDIPAGTPILADLFLHRRTHTGIRASELAPLRGAITAETVRAGTTLRWSQVRIGDDT